MGGLHFFEPRYRWMCQRIFENQPPHVFGFVTHGGANSGSTGVLCEVSRFRGNDDGTFDVSFVARSSFSVLEVWSEKVPNQPHAPALAVGLLDIDRKIESPAGASVVRVVQSRHVSAGRTSRIFTCLAANLRCCPPRRR